MLLIMVIWVLCIRASDRMSTIHEVFDYFPYDKDNVKRTGASGYKRKSPEGIKFTPNPTDHFCDYYTMANDKYYGCNNWSQAVLAHRNLVAERENTYWFKDLNYTRLFPDMIQDTESPRINCMWCESFIGFMHYPSEPSKQILQIPRERITTSVKFDKEQHDGDTYDETMDLEGFQPFDDLPDTPLPERRS